MISILSPLRRHATAIAAAILLTQGVFYYTGSAAQTIPTVAPWNQFPEEVGGWSARTDLVLGSEVLNALQPDDYLARTYSTPSDPYAVSLFIGYFNSRRDGRAPHSPQWCLPGSGWKSVSSRIISIPVPRTPDSFPVNEYRIEKGIDKELVLYWYHQGSRTVANEVVAQFLSLPDLIFHSRTDTALVRIIVPVRDSDPEGAKAAGVKFAQAVYPLIRKHIT
jgi:EpsI family protein